MSEIWGIILAAGESKRMGRPKLLLPFLDKTIIEKSIENLLHAKIDHILVITGSHSSEISSLLRYMPVIFCHNDSYKNGMLSSVKCGMKVLPSGCEAVLIFPGDEPLISPDVINRTIEGYRISGKGIVIPTFQHKRGHPLLIGRKYLKEVEGLEENQGLKALAVKFPQDVLEVETSSEGILKDIDTKEEYEEILKVVQKEGMR